ncbi:hypothetical protein IMCC20628_00714 [Hoeflea sp. IMCC20628]|uniref:hypothetical protein n=1 Tax=Hoeflea sp. IMCC20628 TaxID=1620421 RepID=UPI00063BED5D|nr:hypothetical protein [Hoeflea sp. IMCC20628]AKH99438.1 hypothetical protein IMCC20628_00714 [Hoeflea sp. IMCC20628]
MERILTIFAFIILCGFLGVLVYKLPRLDLGAVIGLTVAMAFYDLFVHKRPER